MQGNVKPEVEKGGEYVEACQFPGEATILEKIQKAPTNLDIRYLHKNLIQLFFSPQHVLGPLLKCKRCRKGNLQPGISTHDIGLQVQVPHLAKLLRCGIKPTLPDRRCQFDREKTRRAEHLVNHGIRETCVSINPTITNS